MFYCLHCVFHSRCVVVRCSKNVLAQLLTRRNTKQYKLYLFERRRSSCSRSCSPFGHAMCAQTQTDNKTSPSCPTAHITYSRNLCYCISCPALFLMQHGTLFAWRQCALVCTRVSSAPRSRCCNAIMNEVAVESSTKHTRSCCISSIHHWQCHMMFGPLLFLTFVWSEQAWLHSMQLREIITSYLYMFACVSVFTVMLFFRWVIVRWYT